jgi:hypothetical protein
MCKHWLAWLLRSASTQNSYIHKSSFILNSYIHKSLISLTDSTQNFESQPEIPNSYIHNPWFNTEFRITTLNPQINFNLHSYQFQAYNCHWGWDDEKDWRMPFDENRTQNRPNLRIPFDENRTPKLMKTILVCFLFSHQRVCRVVTEIKYFVSQFTKTPYSFRRQWNTDYFC